MEREVYKTNRNGGFLLVERDENGKGKWERRKVRWRRNSLRSSEMDLDGGCSIVLLPRSGLVGG